MAFRALDKTSRIQRVEEENRLEQEAFQNVMKQQPGVTLQLPSCQDRWNALIELVQNPNFFNHSSKTPIPVLNPQDPLKPYANKRYFFTNDLFLLGYSLGLTKRLCNSDAGQPTFLWQEWGLSNASMEQYHSYVQWWFPSVKPGVDWLYSERLTPTLLRNLEGTTCQLLLQAMNRRHVWPLSGDNK